MSDDLIERACAYVEKGEVQDGPAEVMASLAARIEELEKERDRLKNMREVVAKASQEEAVGLARQTERAALDRADALAALLREAEGVFRLRRIYHETRCDKHGGVEAKTRAREAWLAAEAALLARLEARETKDGAE